jgi:ribosome-associated translation inhibitor RaiA
MSPSTKERQNMQTPVRITFRHTDPSPALEARIRSGAESLGRFFPHLTGCHVVVDRDSGEGHDFHVAITLDIPGASLAVTGATEPGGDAHAAVRGAFALARRRLLHHRGVRPC